MKILPAICCLLLLNIASPAQTIKPCDKWLTGFIDAVPKMSDGSCIGKYLAGKLQADTLLKAKATCMVGLRIYLNCKGEFSYDKMEYRNNVLLAAQCDELLNSTEGIINKIKLFSPGTINHQKKDFIFKLVVKVKHNGKVKTGILF